MPSDLKDEGTYEVVAWEISHLGNCHLGKYHWEVDTWEKYLNYLTS